MGKQFVEFDGKHIPEKLSNLRRLHSRLIHLSEIDGVLDDTFENNGYTIDAVLDAFKRAIQCFNTFGDKNRKFINYLKSIDQAISLTSIYRKKDKSKIKRSYCFMYGEFEIYLNAYKNRINKHCEIEYQDACHTIYRLVKLYLK